MRFLSRARKPAKSSPSGMAMPDGSDDALDAGEAREMAFIIAALGQDRLTVRQWIGLLRLVLIHASAGGKKATKTDASSTPVESS